MPGPTEATIPAPLRIALICSPGALGSIVLRTLRAMRADVLLICTTRSSVRFSRFRKQVLVAEPDIMSMPEQVCEAINAEHGKFPIDVVMATDVDGLSLLTKIQHVLRPPVFPMSDLATLEQLGSKWSFYHLCLDHGIPTPRTAFVSSKHEIDRTLLEQFPYPFLVKPLGEAGGSGICVIRSKAQLEELVVSNNDYAFGALLLQEYIEGSDFVMGLFAVKGEILNWAIFADQGRFSTSFVRCDPLLEQGRRLIEATGFTGIANFDARIHGRTALPYMLECNPRLFRRVLELQTAGLDLIQAGLSQMGLGGQQPRELTHGLHLSLSDLLTPRGGRQLLTGAYPLRLALKDVQDWVLDPIPRLAPALNRAYGTLLARKKPININFN